MGGSLSRPAGPSSPRSSTLVARSVGSRAVGSVVILCLFAFALNAFAAYPIFLGLAGVILLAKNVGKLGSIPIDTNFLVLVLFATTYSLIAGGGLGQAVIAFLIPAGYLVGLLFVRERLDSGVQFRRLILALAAGMTAHGVLNAASNLRLYGLSPTDRSPLDIWTGDFLTPTLQATLFVPLVGFAYYGLFVRQRHRALIGIVTSVALGIAGLYSLSTASRTIFLVAAITFGACFLASLGLVSHTRLPVLTLTAAGATFVAYYLYSSPAFPLRSLFEQSALNDRLAQSDATTLAEDPRFVRWSYAADHFWEYPSGGLNFRGKIGYIHNMWLDAYDVGGVLPFLALIGFTLSSLILLARLVRLAAVAVELKILLVGVWVAFLTQFMTEPILDGMPQLFVLFCVISGAAKALADGVLAEDRDGWP